MDTLQQPESTLESDDEEEDEAERASKKRKSTKVTQVSAKRPNLEEEATSDDERQTKEEYPSITLPNLNNKEEPATLLAFHDEVKVPQYGVLDSKDYVQHIQEEITDPTFLDSLQQPEPALDSDDEEEDEVERASKKRKSTDCYVHILSFC